MRTLRHNVMCAQGQKSREKVSCEVYLSTVCPSVRTLQEDVRRSTCGLHLQAPPEEEDLVVYKVPLNEYCPKFQQH